MYVHAIQRLNAIETEIRNAVAELQVTQLNLEQEYSVLISQRDERKTLIDTADADLQGKGNTLEQMERDRAALKKVIDQIEKQRALAKAQEEERQQQEALRQQQEQQKQESQKQEPSNKPSAAPAYSADDLKRLQSQSFTQRKGNLMWPVQGKVIHSFGQQRQGSMTWDGLRIQASSGSDVLAIHGGRVMYADSLPGQGLLLVLDHGDGYMSLYAHNDVLLHESGEWVQPGDAIARVGNSGGEKESGLYFEIRQNGEPINPTPWLLKQ